MLAISIGACEGPDEEVSFRYITSTTQPPSDPDEPPYEPVYPNTTHDPSGDPDEHEDPDNPDEPDDYPDLPKPDDPDNCDPPPPPPPPPKDVCDYRTQTQGGWGTSCSGHNPGCFRDAYFDQAFPHGLTIGCYAGTARFKNSDAIQDALPTGGTPRKLLYAELGDYDGHDDPKFGTVLVGQVTALSLSIGFSKLHQFVKQGKTPFPKLVLAEGECAGMTVQEVLDAANDALGGCYSTLSPGEANTCVTQINESFVDGKPKCSELFKQPPHDPKERLSLGCY